MGAVGDVDGVAGEGGEVVEQVAEGVGGQVAGGGLMAVLACAFGDRRAGATGSAGAGLSSSV